MPGKWYTPEQIVAKLREAEKLQGQGFTIPAVCKRLHVRSRRRSAAGGRKGDTTQSQIVDDFAALVSCRSSFDPARSTRTLSAQYDRERPSLANRHKRVSPCGVRTFRIVQRRPTKSNKIEGFLVRVQMGEQTRALRVHNQDQHA